MKKLAMTVLATAMLSGPGMALAGGGDFGTGLLAESHPGSLFGNAYASPAYVPAGYPAYYGPPATMPHRPIAGEITGIGGIIAIGGVIMANPKIGAGAGMNGGSTSGGSTSGGSTSGGSMNGANASGMTGIDNRPARA